MIKERTLTVAVLPFVNVSADPRIDEIGEALARALRTYLQNADALCVSCDCQNTTGDDDLHISALGRTMHADALLFGCICVANGILRAKAQIVDAGTGKARWSTQLECPADSATAEDLAEQVAIDLERAMRLGF